MDSLAAILAGSLKSKTMWFNGLTLLGLVLDHVAGSGLAAAGGPVTLAVVTGINLVLRAYTNKALADK